MLLVPIPVWQLSLVSWHLTSCMSLFNTFNGKSLFTSPAFLISYLHSLLVFIPLFSACLSLVLIYSLLSVLSASLHHCLLLVSLSCLPSAASALFIPSVSCKLFLSSFTCFCFSSFPSSFSVSRKPFFSTFCCFSFRSSVSHSQAFLVFLLPSLLCLLLYLYLAISLRLVF